MKQLDDNEYARRVEIVINEYNGIVPYNEAFYIQSILYAAQASDDAFERFAAHVIHGADDALIVSAVQEALTHAAALSRFFWPVGAGKNRLGAARAEKLRWAFQMQNSPLFDRQLRNAMEHFDERLDKFLISVLAGQFIPSAIVAPHGSIKEPITHIFRLVDPWELVFILLGERFSFAPIKDEIQRIINLGKRFDADGSRLAVRSNRPSGQQ
jgi:hypothetical protein